MTTMYCESCGAAGQDRRFCDQCGKPLDAARSGAPRQTATVGPGAPLVPQSPTISAQSSPALRGISTVGTRGRARSAAWIYYTILAVGSLIALFTGKAIGLVGVVLFGAYASYLYRGGRVVIWFW